MPLYEYKTVSLSGKYKKQQDIDVLDKTLNDAAGKGWELVTISDVANNWSDHGKTSGLLITFRRVKESG